ncbi:serine/threonine protein kinase [Oligoflexaceae bacterium]|nr:serine/threonine protein kinase [Oligoflexaceae bacterium]
MATPTYKIIEKINTGEMSEILLGAAYNDTGFDQIVTIKRLKPDVSKNQSLQDLFLREANIIKKLCHVNIKSFKGFADIEGQKSMILGYIHGHNVKELLDFSNKLSMKASVSMAVHIATEVARGLHFCHSFSDSAKNEDMGIIHTDISPENILISYEGEIKIIDFGLAQTPEVKNLEYDGKRNSKLRYMSPEFIKNSIGTPSSDIYSLGMVLYELLTGEDLFVGQHLEEIYEKKLSPPRAEELIKKNDLLDLELSEIVLKCIYPDPNQRFQSALELDRHLSLYFHRRDPEYMPRKLGNFLKQMFTIDHKKVETMIEHSAIHKKNDDVADTIMLGSEEKTQVPQSIEEILKLFKNKKADVPIVHRGKTLELNEDINTIQLATPKGSSAKPVNRITQKKSNKTSAPLSNHSSERSVKSTMPPPSHGSSQNHRSKNSNRSRRSSKSSIKRRPKERIVKKDNTNQILQAILIIAVLIVVFLFLRSRF